MKIIRRTRVVSPLTGLVLACAACVLAAPAAANRPVDHFRDSFSYVSSDFCGTGETVLGEGTITLTAWDLGGGVSKVTREFSQTLTNPANGNVVYNHVGGQTSSVFVGDASGGGTITFVDTGVRSTLRVPGGGVQTLDAGNLHWTLTLDASGNVVDAQVLDVHGPHPDALSGALAGGAGAYCQAAIAALGL